MCRSWPTPHTIPLFLPPEDPYPVRLRQNKKNKKMKIKTQTKNFNKRDLVLRQTKETYFSANRPRISTMSYPCHDVCDTLMSRFSALAIKTQTQNFNNVLNNTTIMQKRQNLWIRVYIYMYNIRTYILWLKYAVVVFLISIYSIYTSCL
jgi:hypothetical protein